ncbi:hypothetical protein AGMMS50276_11140 [Synergistales bacterium]|nr:hypothetical protein AGMMS50276_11140 [Synergistales bacterium]
MYRFSGLKFCLNTYVPFVKFAFNRDILWSSRDVLAFSVAHPADFRQEYPIIRFIEFEALRVVKAIVQSSFLEVRKLFRVTFIKSLT